MKWFKFFLFISFLILIVVIANLINIPVEPTEHYVFEAKEGSFNTNTLIEYQNGVVKSLAGISTTIVWSDIPGLFNVKEKNIRGQVLRKKIYVLGYDATLLLFVGDNLIEQITVGIDYNSDSKEISGLISSILAEAEVQFELTFTENIEDIDGSVLASITKFENEKNILRITTVDGNETMNLSIDIILKY